MTTSRSFDRAADIYDQTRPLLEPIRNEGLPAILEQAGAHARILEVGAGTGRISIPLLERGADLIGCDISAKMLGRLQEKYPAARIAQADASRLPFPTNHFEAVLTVHVMHLIPPWREALREFQRVLVPGGVYLNVRTWDPVGVSIRSQVRGFWRSWLKERGVEAESVGIQDGSQFLPELQALGAQLSEVDVVHYPLTFTLRAELGRFESRSYSDAWHIPDDLHTASVEALRAWAVHAYGDLDQERADEVRFAMDIARFPA